jgi:hypothetical protein
MQSIVSLGGSEKEGVESWYQSWRKRNISDAAVENIDVLADMRQKIVEKAGAMIGLWIKLNKERAVKPDSYPSRFIHMPLNYIHWITTGVFDLAEAPPVDGATSRSGCILSTLLFDWLSHNYGHWHAETVGKELLVDLTTDESENAHGTKKSKKKKPVAPKQSPKEFTEEKPSVVPEFDSSFDEVVSEASFLGNSMEPVEDAAGNAAKETPHKLEGKVSTGHESQLEEGTKSMSVIAKVVQDKTKTAETLEADEFQAGGGVKVDLVGKKQAEIEHNRVDIPSKTDAPSEPHLQEERKSKGRLKGQVETKPTEEEETNRQKTQPGRHNARVREQIKDESVGRQSTPMTNKPSQVDSLPKTRRPQDASGVGGKGHSANGHEASVVALDKRIAMGVVDHSSFQSVHDFLLSRYTDATNLPKRGKSKIVFIS